MSPLILIWGEPETLTTRNRLAVARGNDMASSSTDPPIQRKVKPHPNFSRFEHRAEPFSGSDLTSPEGYAPAAPALAPKRKMLDDEDSEVEFEPAPAPVKKWVIPKKPKPEPAKGRGGGGGGGGDGWVKRATSAAEIARNKEKAKTDRSKGRTPSKAAQKKKKRARRDDDDDELSDDDDDDDDREWGDGDSDESEQPRSGRKAKQRAHMRKKLSAARRRAARDDESDEDDESDGEGAIQGDWRPLLTQEEKNRAGCAPSSDTTARPFWQLVA